MERDTNFLKDFVHGEYDLENSVGTTWVCDDPLMRLEITDNNNAKCYITADNSQTEIHLRIDPLSAYTFSAYSVNEEGRYTSDEVMYGDYTIRGDKLTLSSIEYDEINGKKLFDGEYKKLVFHKKG